MLDRVKLFYDEFATRLLADYAYGNPRIEAAIAHVLRWIPKNAKRILDVGCGIGWSTWEIKRKFRDAYVLGIDISPKMIEIANRLFEAPGLCFAVQDITCYSNLLCSPFDVIVMIDVYEHIAKESRKAVCEMLKGVLKQGGILVLTFPSVFYQNLLRTHYPEQLQPIDEDITFEEIEKLAYELDGRVVYLSYVNIWRPNDYVHAVIKRDKEGRMKEKPNLGKRAKLESQQSRRNRIISRLRVRVTSEGVLLPDQGSYTVCIISPNKNAYSETFIRAHIEQLPAKVKVLYGGWVDGDTDRHILPWSLRGICFALRRGLHRPHLASRIERMALHNFLKRSGVHAVLAEYGPTGVAVMDACLKARLPLVVHFHGFDASDHRTLEQCGLAYRRLFGIADAVIAVSRDMEQKLLELGAAREKLFYNPCGVDTVLFSGADPASAPPIFVAVGRFVDKKAPHLTLLAFKKVVDAVPDARLIMIGDGELWEACKQMAKALKIDHVVKFLGPRPHAEVAATMRMARAFVQHSIKASYGDSEGTPVAVLEAGAAGLPVVSTKHGGIKDVVIDGETGFLVDEGNVEGMAERMLLLAKDPDLAARLGRKARDRICAEFSIEKSIGNLWRIIEGIIQEHRK